MNPEQIQFEKYTSHWRAEHVFTVLLRDDNDKVRFVAEEYHHVGGVMLRYICNECLSGCYQFWPRGGQPHYLLLEDIQTSHMKCPPEPVVFHINSNSGTSFVKK